MATTPLNGQEHDQCAAGGKHVERPLAAALVEAAASACRRLMPTPP